MDHIILHPKTKTRILRPKEFQALLEAVPKMEHQDLLEVLLYTGARYSEIQALYKHPQWFQGNAIHMPSFKKKAVYSGRYIRLNKQGERAVKYFFKNKKSPPHYVGFDNNLKRWAQYAKLDPNGLSIKTTRKTWESWLVTKYPQQLEYIFLSQGHSRMTALKYYLMLPFNNEDKEYMENYTSGWI